MKSIACRCAAFAVVAVMAFAARPGSAANQVQPGAGRPAAVAAGSLMPQVRLRKLHLVRPDLIMYPIEVEVYC